MGLFDKILNNNSTSPSSETVYKMPTSSLVKASTYATAEPESNVIATIDEDTAMKIGALYQGVGIITDTIASLSMYLYKEQDGFQEVFYDDPRSRVLSDMANETLSSFNLKKVLLKDLILRGNAYAKIERVGKEIYLRYLPTSVVTPKMDGSGYYFEVQSYATEVSGERYPAEIVDFHDMLVLTRHNQYNSITGKGLLDYANDVFATSVEETNYMYNLLVNGLSSKAILNSKTPFKREIKEQLKRDLREYYQGSSNAGKIMLLEGDISVSTLAMTPTDIKLLENKAFTIAEISRFLNIPTHMLGLDRQQGTYSNIVQERLNLLQNTLMPYVVILEQAMNQKLLDDNERANGYYFKFDVSELMKMTPQDNADFMLKLFDANVCTIEEVRASLGLGGDSETIEYLKQVQIAKSNMVLSSMSEQANGTPDSKEEGEPPKTEDEPAPVDDADDDKEKKESSKEVKK